MAQVTTLQPLRRLRFIEGWGSSSTRPLRTRCSLSGGCASLRVPHEDPPAVGQGLQPLRRLRFIEGGPPASWAGTGPGRSLSRGCVSLRGQVGAGRQGRAVGLQPLRRLRFIGPALLSPGPGPPGPGPGAQWPSSSHREPGCRPSAHGRRLAPRLGRARCGRPSCAGSPAVPN